MGYRSTVKSGVRRAFAAAKDLAKNITLVQKDATDFDFANNETVESATTSSTIKGILLNKRRDKLGNTIQAELLLISDDVDDLTIYDRVTIDGIIWNLVPPYVDNEYTIRVNIARGG